MSTTRRTQSAATFFACLSSLAGPLFAVDAGPVAIHGSISATAAVSDRYNYLGDTKDSPSINAIEAVINGSHRFENGLAASAQLYAYEVDNYSDVALDFATLDYAFNEQIGVRAGRVKRPAGLYGDVQDIDLLRPFAYLPLGFYEKTLRPITASLDGAVLYGALNLGAAGSLDYQLGYGWLPPIAADTPYIRSAAQNALNTIDDFDGDKVSTVWVFWNLPVDGLRVGYSRNETTDFTLSGPMKTAAEVAQGTGDARFTAQAFPPGVWDMIVAGRPASLHGDSLRQTGSVEYTRAHWQFAAEYQRVTNETDVNYPAPLGVQASKSSSESAYVMATWQATDRWQFGAYYGETVANTKDRRGRSIVAPPRHIAWQNDLAVAASFAATDWWLVKAEIHQIDGTLGLSARANAPVDTWKADWTYFVLKTTLSF